MKRWPGRKHTLALFMNPFTSASFGAIRGALEHAAKRKSTGCVAALRLIVSPFTNEPPRVNPETRKITYTLFLCFVPSLCFIGFLHDTWQPWNLASPPRSFNVWHFYRVSYNSFEWEICPSSNFRWNFAPISIGDIRSIFWARHALVISSHVTLTEIRFQWQRVRPTRRNNLANIFPG